MMTQHQHGSHRAFGFGLAFSALFAAGLILSGCASTALSPGRSVLDVAQNKAQDPLMPLTQPTASASSQTGFIWEQQVLTATGQGKAPEGMPAAQAELTATNSARVHALAQLKSQVKDLPVGTDQTVGSIMTTYLTIRHAIEQEIASAPIAGQRSTAPGRMEVQVSLSMQNIANILQQYQITPDKELPATNISSPSVPDII